MKQSLWRVCTWHNVFLKTQYGQLVAFSTSFYIACKKMECVSQVSGFVGVGKLFRIYVLYIIMYVCVYSFFYGKLIWSRLTSVYCMKVPSGYCFHQDVVKNRNVNYTCRATLHYTTWYQSPSKQQHKQEAPEAYNRFHHSILDKKISYECVHGILRWTVHVWRCVIFYHVFISPYDTIR